MEPKVQIQKGPTNQKTMMRIRKMTKIKMFMLKTFLIIKTKKLHELKLQKLIKDAMKPKTNMFSNLNLIFKFTSQNNNQRIKATSISVSFFHDDGTQSLLSPQRKSFDDSDAATMTFNKCVMSNDTINSPFQQYNLCKIMQITFALFWQYSCCHFFVQQTPTSNYIS